MDGRPCRTEGTLHAQVELILNVPNVVQDALQNAQVGPSQH